MGRPFTRSSYPLDFWGRGVNVSERDSSTSEKWKRLVSWCSTRSLFASVRPLEVANWFVRTCTPSYPLRFRNVTFSSGTYLFQQIRSVALVRVLLATCSGLSVFLWLLFRYWQILQSDRASSCTPSFTRTGGVGAEKYSDDTLGGGSNGPRRSIFSLGQRHTAKNSSRPLQSDRFIHSCDQSSTAPAVRPDVECKNWYSNAVQNKARARTRSVWFLLSRRRPSRTSALPKEIVPTHECCQFSAAERQLSQLKILTGNHFFIPFSRAVASSAFPSSFPATPLRASSVLPSEIHARVFLPPFRWQFSSASQQSLHNDSPSYDASVWTGRGSLGSGTGRMASLFDLWQQMEPLSSEMKQFLVRNLTEKAVSHVLWLYKWQKEYAVPLFIRYLLQRAGGIQQEDGTDETERADTEDVRTDDDDELEEGDDDGGAEEGIDGGGFSVKYSSLPEPEAVDSRYIRSKDRKTETFHGERSGDNFFWPPRGQDETLLSAARQTDTVDTSSSFHTIDHDRENSLYRREGAGNVGGADEAISIIGNSEGSYNIHDSLGAHLITPDSPTWDPVLEIDQETYFGAATVMGDTFSAIVTKNIPNITRTIDRLNLHIGEYLQRYKDAVWSLPLQQIVNATLNGGMFPPLVQLQNASFPDFKRDVRCNPDVQVCQNLGSFLRAVGGLIRRVYHSTYPYNYHLRAEVAANLLHTAVVGQRVTATFYSFVEQIVTAAVLETVLNTTTSLIEIPPDSQVFTLINAILSLIGDVYSLADMAPEEMELMNLVRSKVRAAFYCRLFNGRLPYCRPSPPSPILVPDIPREIVFDPYTGFVKFIFFVGFEQACIQQGGCFADLLIDGGNFDGFYALLGVGSTGFPVYQGYRYFPQFLDLTRLFFWQGFRPSVIDASQGSWAAITGAPDTYFTSTRGQLFPFASLATLEPPNNCSGSPPVPFGDPDTNFPLCLNVSAQWVVGRIAALGNCNGFLYSHVCVFPSTVTIFPTSSPAFWTLETSTSTVAPPSTAPPTPPGGGVPPGGTGGGGTEPVTPSSKKEEDYPGVNTKVEYIFWDEGDSLFDTSYPWERENLLSGWTGRRRRALQKLGRGRVGSSSSVDPPRKYPARNRKVRSRKLKHDGDTVTTLFTIEEESYLDSAPNHGTLHSPTRGEDKKDVFLISENSRTFQAFNERAGGGRMPNDRDATVTSSAVSQNSATLPEIELLHGEAARKVVARRLEGLTGINGRRFQSSIPVHRSQFVDGFSGKVVTYIPPFFPFPPELL